MYGVHNLNTIDPAGEALWTAEYEKISNFGQADVILVRSAPMHDLQLSENLLAVARAGAGVNNIPLEKCAENGTVVFNTPGANADSVMELALCGMLLGCRDILGGIDWVKSIASSGNVAKLVEKEKSRFSGHELRKKTLGVIGLGAVGGQLANTCRNLGMQVYGCDPYLSIDGAWHLNCHVKRVADRAEIYEKCDIISIHTPLLPKTRGMIDAAAIAKMRPGVIIVNMARDALVDDDAMESALKSGKVAAYVTDFPNDKTAVMPGCIPIPHLGASTAESEANCARMAVRQVRDYLENGNITNSVNFPDCDMGVCHAAGRITILHRNIPNSLGQFTAAVAGENINIAGLMNRSRGDYAVTILDLDQAPSPDMLQNLSEIPGTLRVRHIVGHEKPR